MQQFHHYNRFMFRQILRSPPIYSILSFRDTHKRTTSWPTTSNIPPFFYANFALVTCNFLNINNVICHNFNNGKTKFNNPGLTYFASKYRKKSLFELSFE